MKQKRSMRYRNVSASWEEKQKEIIDSIHYAKRIQLSQLPSERIIFKNMSRLTKKWIVYIPK